MAKTEKDLTPMVMGYCYKHIDDDKVFIPLVTQLINYNPEPYFWMAFKPEMPVKFEVMDKFREKFDDLKNKM